MEGLNKLNRSDDRRFYSKEALAYSEIINTTHPLTDQSIAVSVIMNQLSSNSFNTNHSINLNSSQKLSNTLNIPKNIQSSCQYPKSLASPLVKLNGLLFEYNNLPEAEKKSR